MIFYIFPIFNKPHEKTRTSDDLVFLSKRPDFLSVALKFLLTV